VTVTATTLIAERTDTGERLTIGDAPLEALRALSEARLLRCPYCGGGLLLKAGTVRLHHFAHLSADLCASADHEAETDAHRAGKLLLYQHFRQGATHAAVEHHLPATDQRADVYVLVAGQGYALEFQQANNPAARWRQRHALYRAQGLRDLWFLGQVRYQPAEPPRPISPFDPLPVPREGFEAAAGAFRIREMEKAMLTISPVLRYFDPESGMLTVLLGREQHGSTLRAYRYCCPLSACSLHDGDLRSPLEPLLSDFWAYQQARSRLDG
jgi:hypothetical protein